MGDGLMDRVHLDKGQSRPLRGHVRSLHFLKAYFYVIKACTKPMTNHYNYSWLDGVMTINLKVTPKCKTYVFLYHMGTTPALFCPYSLPPTRLNSSGRVCRAYAVKHCLLHSCSKYHPLQPRRGYSSSGCQADAGACSSLSRLDEAEGFRAPPGPCIVVRGRRISQQ